MFLMQSVVNSVLRIKGDRPLNIVTLSYNDEKYIESLCSIGHNFYLWKPNGFSDWNQAIAPIPSNLSILTEQDVVSPTHFDLIICHDRLDQLEHAEKISEAFHLPVIVVDHCHRDTLRPHPAMGNIQINDALQLTDRSSISMRVSSSNEVQESWNDSCIGSVVRPGIDTERFSPPARQRGYEERVVTFDNNLPEHMARGILADINRYHIIPVDSNDKSSRTDPYHRGDLFVNTYKNVTIKLLEAMSCECIPICFDFPDLRELISNGENGIIIDSPEKIHAAIDSLYESPEHMRAMGASARSTVIESHGIENFAKGWGKVLDFIRPQFYNR